MAQPTRRNPPRSSKSAAISSYTPDSEWFPDIKNPTSEVHHQLNILNNQAYPSDMFAKADNFLIFSLFVQKGQKRRHHRVKPEPALPSSSHHLSNKDGTLAANICKVLLSNNEPSWDTVLQSVKDLQDHIEAFRSDEASWSACLSQYSLPYSSGSRVCIGKVVYGGKAGFCLKAKVSIPPGTFIMETCSSLALDAASGPGPSIIYATSKLQGPIGPRLILGPFRFVNHDCNPNSQISPIQGTYACVIVTIRPIDADEEITAKYQEGGYYGKKCLCQTCTGTDTSDLSVLKPNRNMDKQPDIQQ